MYEYENICMNVCVCVCVKEKERKREKKNNKWTREEISLSVASSSMDFNFFLTLTHTCSFSLSSHFRSKFASKKILRAHRILINKFACLSFLEYYLIITSSHPLSSFFVTNNFCPIHRILMSKPFYSHFISLYLQNLITNMEQKNFSQTENFSEQFSANFSDGPLWFILNSTDLL